MAGPRIFWRKVGTHRLERFRPGFKKPRTYYKQSPFHRRKFPMSRPTYESAKKGWKKARRFGGSRLHPFNLLPRPKKGQVWGRYKKKSKGKSSSGTTRGRTVKRRKTMRAPSAQKKPKFVRYRKGGCPPGYVYDVKRKMCIHKRYR